jgi:uncharacterized RmlC-like cupin family protein
MAAGDFMFVPPSLAHLEANMRTTEELWWLACRTLENIVVNLPDIDDASLAVVDGREGVSVLQRIKRAAAGRLDQHAGIIGRPI